MDKVDILVITAHPDDAELSCAGTILAHIAIGKKVGIVDLTRGEMGTRGTAALRQEEAANAAKILGVAFRVNLNLADAFFVNDKEHQLEVIKVIRQYRPEIVLANAITDRHPDHGRGASLVRDAVFFSGLQKIETQADGNEQEAWRPKSLYHAIQSNYVKPDIVVDISAHWEKKVQAIEAFRSQFYNPDSDEPDTFISSPEFMLFVEARAKELGHAIGASYGEGFTVVKQIGIKSFFDIK